MSMLTMKMWSGWGARRISSRTAKLGGSGGLLTVVETACGAKGAVFAQIPGVRCVVLSSLDADVWELAL